ncbi:MAG: endopeptidase La [Lentisphaerae bacterium]|nr:endopeptidase La [Lentisphaerota bacterium]
MDITIENPSFEIKDDGNDTIVNAMTVKNLVAFPYTLCSLTVTDHELIKMLKASPAGNRLLAIFPEFPALLDNKNNPDYLKKKKFCGTEITAVGTQCRIIKLLNFPDESVRLLVRGLGRVKFIKLVNDADNFKKAAITNHSEAEDDSTETMAMLKSALAQFHEALAFMPISEDFKMIISNIKDTVRLVDMITDALPIGYEEKIYILNAPDVATRLKILLEVLNREIEIMRLSSKIQTQVNEAMSRSQREFYLREQLKTIQHELGEATANPDVAAIKERLTELELPEYVKNVIDKELARLEMLPSASPEYHVSFNYIDWLVGMPWAAYSEDRLDVAEASRILERDHFGLEDAKEIILEFISVLQLKQDRRAPILCFVGPPGVGKTSLGKSIAEALGRKFIRISLGGIRDEAEIRGHRRTYIGAMPGRIIQGLKKAGTSNPVFMLDEIDKLCNDFRGDPASALLEVLDPAQNKSFSDHFLEIDYDLSSVMFIATANLPELIPPPLRDRMEIVRLPGYTGFEKKQIAKKYLIPRQITENGLKKSNIKFYNAGIDELINHYTREAGVRNLERNIGAICRKVTRKLVTKQFEDDSIISVNPGLVNELLGPRKFLLDRAARNPEPGTAIGMAWTGVGGTILTIEATLLPGGKGALKLTGSLGNVMKESAETAFSYVRSICRKLNIDPIVFDNNDFHIHVPDGATPKDGPSAGIALVTALVSLLTAKKTQSYLSMTGEITLRGRVTAVGGIKEKVIAALRSGIKTVVMPQDNENDLVEVPEEVKSKLTFKFVSNAPEALEFIFKQPHRDDKRK